MFSALSTAVHSDEWKKCQVFRNTATDRDAAIALGKIDKRISFLKRTGSAHITIFLDGKTFAFAELIPTGRRMFNGNEPFEGYADKSNSLIVQEFDDSQLFVSLKGQVDFTFFARCE